MDNTVNSREMSGRDSEYWRKRDECIHQKEACLAKIDPDLKIKDAEREAQRCNDAFNGCLEGIKL